jgi:hypothetical protein
VIFYGRSKFLNIIPIAAKTSEISSHCPNTSKKKKSINYAINKYIHTQYSKATGNLERTSVTESSR